MNLFRKTFPYFTTAILFPLIFQAGQINCFLPNEGSDDRYSPTSSSYKPICTGSRFYFNHTGKCYKRYSKGPCGEQMVLGASNQLPAYEIGECICMPSGKKGRPRVNIPEKNRCYFIFEQEYIIYFWGPCPSGQWLVPLAKNVTVCEPIPCPERYDALTEPFDSFDSGRPFLFSYEGQCYMTGIKGAGPCPPDEEAYIFDVKHVCTAPSFGSEGFGGSSQGGVQSNNCEDGKTPDEYGGCEPFSVL